MLDNKLKYLIIGVILLSVLVVLGALSFTSLQGFKNPPLVKQQINASPSPSANQPGLNNNIRIVYPSPQATTSSTLIQKPAPASRATIASGSASGTGPIPKSVPKP